METTLNNFKFKISLRFRLLVNHNIKYLVFKASNFY